MAEFSKAEVLLENPFALKGTCMEMCPKRERILRENQGRLHPFEVTQESLTQPKTQKPKADINAIVKEYSRPAAGRHLEAEELRPASVLAKTIEYLLRDVLAKPNPWYYKCDFVSDRIRAIRQDLTAQHIINQDAIDTLEKATRYYLVAGVKLCREPVENYDPVLHNKHTQECLKKLLFLYEFGQSEKKTHPNRPSFEACYLLLNLGSPEAYYRMYQLSPNIRKTNVMQQAIKLTKAYIIGNFVKIFQILMKLSYLESCAFLHHIQPIRSKALAVMNTAYSSKNLNFPLSVLKKIFYFDSEDVAAEFCIDHGVNVMCEKVFFSKGQFLDSKKHMPLPCHELIELKLKGNVTDVLLLHEQGSNEQKANNVDEKKFGFCENDVGICQTSSSRVSNVTTGSQVLIGVKKEELVPGKKKHMGYRGRGRARREQSLT